jgi:small subunit ribosomal protein S8e
LILNIQEAEVADEEVKKSNHVQRKLEQRQKDRQLDPHIEEQFGGGRLLACISSRPGQCGRSDGYVYLSLFLNILDKLHICFFVHCSFLISYRYILEGKELEFYMKKLQKKKGKGATA